MLPMESLLLEKWTQFRPLILLPFQLWLWAVSIPIRFFLYLTLGEFWKWSEMAKTRNATKGASFFSAIPSANLSSKKSESSQRGPLLKSDQSVLSEERVVLKSAWKNDYLSRDSLLQRAPASTLTTSDADVMQARPNVRKIEVDFSKAKAAGSKSAAPAISAQRRVRPVDSENRIGSFIAVDKSVHDSFTKKEEKIPSFFVALDSFEEPRVNAFEKHEQAIASFISLDSDVAPESMNLKSEDERIHGFFPLSEESAPIERSAPKSAEKKKKAEKPAAPKSAEKKKKVEESAALPKSDDSEYRMKFEELSKQKSDLENQLAEFSKTQNNKNSLLEMNIRKNFDLQQELSKVQFLLREHDMEKARLQNEYSDLQRNFEELSNKQKEAALKKNEMKEAEKPAEPQHNAWAHADLKKGYTELVLEEQQHNPNKTFAETLKESINVPAEKSNNEEFTVVGGAESAQHVTAPISAV